MGTYVLALRLDAGRTIAIGSLGQYRFPAGWYLYVGSARGPGGLRARLERHRRRLGPDKKVHWHIDFLREYGTWAGAWVRRADEHLECAWARRLGGLPGVAVVVPGFGASDCRCAAHLFHLAALPDDGWFARALGAERIVLQNRRLEDLVAALLEGSDEHREQAAVALGNLGTAVLAPLAELLDSQDADARWWAARALAEVGGGEAARLLAGILADSNPDVRACACLALGRIGGRQAAIDLAACLADESPFVAGIAADALSMIGEPAVSVLAECLSTKNTHLRLLAVRALSRIRSKAAIPSLISMLEDSSYLVRHYAEEGLEALGLGLVLFSP